MSPLRIQTRVKNVPLRVKPGDRNVPLPYSSLGTGMSSIKPGDRMSPSVFKPGDRNVPPIAICHYFVLVFGNSSQRSGNGVIQRQ